MTVAVPRDWRGVRNRYKQAPERVRVYFESIPALLEEYDWEISIAYAFLKLEQSHNYCLYAGARKLHRANPDVASRFIDKHHITRRGFQNLFKNVIGVKFPSQIENLIKHAETIRDKVIHGKRSTPAEHRKALVSILEYAIKLDEFVVEKAGFSPFVTDRRGLTGRGAPLDRSTTAWLMRGLGFNNQEQAAESDD